MASGLVKRVWNCSKNNKNIVSDNQSMIHLSKNQQIHSRIKHIDIRYHFVREQIENGSIEVFKVHTSENAVDMLTKSCSTIEA